MAFEEFCVPSSVVEMKMRVDNEIDLARADTSSGEVLRERVAFVEGVNVAELGSPFGTVACFDEDIFVRCAGQQRVCRKADTIARIGWGFFLPERFRNNAEHGAAVEIEIATVDVPDFDVAETHSG